MGEIKNPGHAPAEGQESLELRSLREEIGAYFSGGELDVSGLEEKDLKVWKKLRHGRMSAVEFDEWRKSIIVETKGEKGPRNRFLSLLSYRIERDGEKTTLKKP